MTITNDDSTSVAASKLRAGAPAPSLGTILLVLTPFAFGYLLSYLFRGVNAVVAPDLIRELGLSPAQLGLLTSAYLASFSVFQLPLGVLLDRYGPRLVQVLLIALGAVGAALFAFAETLAMLTAGRAILGIAFSGGLMASFKAVVMWVPEPRRALANYFIMSLGGLGLLFATTPLELATRAHGWRGVFLALAGATLLVSLLILLLVPERKQPGAPETLGQQIRQVGRIYSDRVFLGMVPLLATTAGGHIAVQTLWAGPWFKDVAGLDRLGVANSLFVMAAALTVSFILIGVLADWLVRRGVSLLTVMLWLILLNLVVQGALLCNPSDRWTALGLWALFAATGHVAVLAYPWMSRYFGAGLAGRSNTAINLVMFLWAFFAQYAIGAIIGLIPPKPDGGYQPFAYQVAFGTFYAIQLLTLLWYLAHMRRFREAAQ